jgi:hypothetical protein
MLAYTFVATQAEATKVGSSLHLLVLHAVTHTKSIQSQHCLFSCLLLQIFGQSN